MKTILIFGLGNPGKEYEKTRHNAGFMFVDYFRENYREEFGPPTNFIGERVNFSDWEEKKKLKALISTGKCYGKKIILIKPQTFMNLSGEAVTAVKKYYKVKIDNVIIAHDDIDLLLGKYKISKDSSSAGHNGAQSIIDLLGTKNFTRMRIGVENRGEKKITTEKYVLGKFTAGEMKIVKKIIEEIAVILKF